MNEWTVGPRHPPSTSHLSYVLHGPAESSWRPLSPPAATDAPPPPPRHISPTVPKPSDGATAAKAKKHPTARNMYCLCVLFFVLGLVGDEGLRDLRGLRGLDLAWFVVALEKEREKRGEKAFFIWQKKN